MKEIIGQIFSFAAVFLVFISYQAKSHKSLLIIQTVSSVFTMTGYLLLGAYSGALTNLICIARNLLFYRNEKKGDAWRGWPYLMAGLMGLSGVFSWQGPVSLLIIVAFMINTVMISLNDNQLLRKSVFVTSTMALTYDAIFHVYGAVFAEIVCISSAFVGLLRFSREKKKKAE